MSQYSSHTNNGDRGILKIEEKKRKRKKRQIGEQRERERENSNSKTLFYKDCSLGSIKNLSNN